MVHVSTHVITAVHMYITAVHMYITAVHVYITAVHVYITAVHVYITAVHVYITAVHVYITAVHVYITAVHVYITVTLQLLNCIFSIRLWEHLVWAPGYGITDVRSLRSGYVLPCNEANILHQSKI